MIAPFSVFSPLFDDSLVQNADKYILALESLKERYQKFLYDLIRNENPIKIVDCYQTLVKYM